MADSKTVASGGDSSTAAPGASDTKQHVTTAPATAVVNDVDVPDPDEDDLDDLDDMLDDFSAVKIETKKTAAPSGPGRPVASAATDDGAGPSSSAPKVDAASFGAGLEDEFSEEDFQKQLQAGMAELMGDFDKNPEMQAQFENMFKGLGVAAMGGDADNTKPSPSTSSKPADVSGLKASQVAEDLSADASFQETIRRTMARMQASGDQATAAAAAEGSEDDFIAEMMKAMKDMPGGSGEGGEEDFSKMLMGMMEQLTNKDILYEPMKELNDKFPGWMEKNKGKLSEEDSKRYTEQQTLVREMVQKFEEPTFKDSNAVDREYIVDRMQKMQAAGSPPPDLVGEMPSAKEVLDGPDENCAPQ